jgi:isopenicillin N synthase-like dioxygenase
MVSVPVIDLRLRRCRREAPTATNDEGRNDENATSAHQQADHHSDLDIVVEDAEEFARLATELVQALERFGFATLVNHGISNDAIQSAFLASRQFFSLDVTAKNESAYRGHECNCGYIGVGQESHATTAGGADAKETFDIGPEPVSSGDVVGETPWPSDNEEDGFSGERFKSTMVSYFDECNRLQLHLLKLIAVGLGLPSSEFLAAQCDERHCNLRLLHYPSLAVRAGGADSENAKPLDERVVVRGARHTDFGTLTLLAQDVVGGLRVQPRLKKGECFNEGDNLEATHAPWIHVAPVEGALVLNVGDMLQRWTNGRLVATPHQVVSVLPPLHQPAAVDIINQVDDATDVMIPERFSIAFFCNANKNTVLKPIPCLVQASEGPKYEPITAIEYLTRRLTETIRPTSTTTTA